MDPWILSFAKMGSQKCQIKVAKALSIGWRRVQFLFQRRNGICDTTSLNLKSASTWKTSSQLPFICFWKSQTVPPASWSSASSTLHIFAYSSTQILLHVTPTSLHPYECPLYVHEHKMLHCHWSIMAASSSFLILEETDTGPPTQFSGLWVLWALKFFKFQQQITEHNAVVLLTGVLSQEEKRLCWILSIISWVVGTFQLFLIVEDLER